MNKNSTNDATFAFSETLVSLHLRLEHHIKNGKIIQDEGIKECYLHRKDSESISGNRSNNKSDVGCDLSTLLEF